MLYYINYFILFIFLPMGTPLIGGATWAGKRDTKSGDIFMIAILWCNFELSLTYQFWMHRLDKREQTFSQHLFLLVRWRCCQHRCSKWLLTWKIVNIKYIIYIGHLLYKVRWQFLGVNCIFFSLLRIRIKNLHFYMVQGDNWGTIWPKFLSFRNPKF